MCRLSNRKRKDTAKCCYGCYNDHGRKGLGLCSDACFLAYHTKHLDKQEKLVQRHSRKTLLASASSSDEIPGSQSPVRQWYSHRTRSASPQRIDDSPSPQPSSDGEVIPSSQSPPQQRPLPGPVMSSSREVVSTSHYPPQPPPLPRPGRSSRLDDIQIQATLEQSQDFESDLGSQDMD